MSEVTDWLRQYEWTHYCTLTFRFSTSPHAARREFARYIRWLEQRSQHRVDWFNTVERGSGGHTHIHTLLNVANMTGQEIKRTWRSGFTQIRRYNQRKGAPEYTAKQFHNCDMSKHFTEIPK